MGAGSGVPGALSSTPDRIHQDPPTTGALAHEAPLPAPVLAASRDHRVVLLTREGCHLCDEAEQVVRQVVTDLGVGHARVTIDDDRETRDRFTTEVPVVIVDGRIIARWRLAPGDLTSALVHRAEEEQQ
ncbi:hypothetical protein AESSP_01374 [Aestuariimicrobium sp. T2.26MG-19.2B]|nr:hypothetical protein AESSP_01374 [Aestuariimicrobium sp. T2.26MG-19.2B]